uniref:Uncharacterized protein n=1 Tax=Anguilla anguilla TaxID=7936 RepID=A0A0E9RP23_ANGAN
MRKEFFTIGNLEDSSAYSYRGETALLLRMWEAF